MNGPLSWDDARALRKQGDLGAFIKRHMADAHTQCAYRRALVLAHEDLAKKLTEPPIGFTQPEQWNGYIPPTTWNEALNTTPCRPALLALVHEAERRNRQPKEDSA